MKIVKYKQTWSITLFLQLYEQVAIIMRTLIRLDIV